MTTSSACEDGRPLTVGIIGCGRWGANLVRNFSSLEGVRLVGVCDRDPGRRAMVAEKYPGVPTTGDYREFLQPGGPQAVVVATPIETHFPIAHDCLLAGRHVFVEKPLSMRTCDAQELAALAEQRKLVLMVGHLLEYHPAVTFLKGHLASGALGEPVEIRASRVNPVSGRTNLEGAMWGLAPHDLSVVGYLLGTSPAAVRAAAHNGTAGEETVSLEVSYPPAATLHLEVSWRDPDKVRRMTIVGTRQLAVFDDLAESKVCIYDNGRHQGAPAPGEDPALVPDLEPDEPLRRECLHFIDCIRSGRRPRSDAADGLHVVQVLEAAERSLSAHGAPVAVEA